MGSELHNEVFESIISDRLSLLFRKEFGIDSRAERSNKKRPDIICYYSGLLVGLELSYERIDAERDAEERIRQQLADLVIAVWIKKSYSNVPEEILDEMIRDSKFDIKIMIPMQESLLPFLERTIKKKGTKEGWFVDVSLHDFKDFIENSADFLIKEEKVRQLTDEVRNRVNEFVHVMSSFDSKGELSKMYYDLFWKLYGLSLGRNHLEIKEVIFGQVALSIILSSAFYEYSRNYNPHLKGISVNTEEDAVDGLKLALSELLKIDYKIALENTAKILETIPSLMGKQIRKLVDLGEAIVSKRVLLKRDFAGRIYHEITGDLATRKGFATYYTEISSAYMLADLAFSINFHGLAPIDKLKTLENIKVGDFSCGSGTLLTASYYMAERIATKLALYDEIDLDINQLGKRILEEGIYGIDALKYAVQITAINLALMSSENLNMHNLSTVYLGYMKDYSQTFAWLGSLELLKGGERFLGLLAWIEGNLGAAEKVTLSGMEKGFSVPEQFDILIMNPPFARATGRSKKMTEGRNAFFGFIADEEAREIVKRSYEEIRQKVRQDLIKIALEEKHFPKFVNRILNKQDIDLTQYLGIGQAGEGLIFLFLAFKYIRPGGTIAFVLPRNVLAGISWFLARTLLMSRFRLKYVVVSSDPSGNNFSENTNYGEALIVASRREDDTDLQFDEIDQTVFVNILKKPDTALAGMMLAEKIIQFYEKTGLAYSSDIMLNTLSRKELLSYVDNWNRFVAITDVEVSTDLIRMVENNILRLGTLSVKIKFTKFDNLIKSIGINRGGDIIAAFNLPVKGNRIDFAEIVDQVPGSYPILVGSGEEVKRKISVPKSGIGYVLPSRDKPERAKRILGLMSRFLVPNRIRWNTTGVLTLFSDRPVLANVFFMVKLNFDSDELAKLSEKALAMWFTSVWGILLVLMNREETEGAFTRLNTGQWKLLPVIDTRILPTKTLKNLAKIFDEFRDIEFKDIQEQFNTSEGKQDNTRLEFDLKFLQAFDSDLNEEYARKELLNLYDKIKVSLDSWLGKNESTDLENGMTENYKQTTLRI